MVVKACLRPVPSITGLIGVLRLGKEPKGFEHFFYLLLPV